MYLSCFDVIINVNLLKMKEKKKTSSMTFKYECVYLIVN